MIYSPIPYIKDNLSKFVKRGKDKTKKLFTPNVVYQLKCNKCTASYVGESKRLLTYRCMEHQRDIRKKHDKVVPNHCTNGHNINWDKISILDNEQNLYKRHISKMLHIQLQDRPLNKKCDTNSLQKSYKHIAISNV